jgi:hypothetical protein
MEARARNGRLLRTNDNADPRNDRGWRSRGGGRFWRGYPAGAVARCRRRLDSFTPLARAAARMGGPERTRSAAAWRRTAEARGRPSVFFSRLARSRPDPRPRVGHGTAQGQGLARRARHRRTPARPHRVGTSEPAATESSSRHCVATGRRSTRVRAARGSAQCFKSWGSHARGSAGTRPRAIPSRPSGCSASAPSRSSRSCSATTQ